MILKMLFKDLKGGSRFKTLAGEFIKTQCELLTNFHEKHRIQNTGNSISLDNAELVWIEPDQFVEILPTDLFTLEDYENGEHTTHE